MNSARERHNAKARQSTAGQRKKGKRKGLSATTKEPDYDANSEIIVPKSQEQKEVDRRERLKQEVSVYDVYLVPLKRSISGEAPGRIRVESEQQEEEAFRKIHRMYSSTVASATI